MSTLTNKFQSGEKWFKFSWGRVPKYSFVLTQKCEPNKAFSTLCRNVNRLATLSCLYFKSGAFSWTEQVSDFRTRPLECTAAYQHRRNGHCTFFSGENLRGSTMYKSSGPTKEGREGARLKEWHGNYEHVRAWLLASSRTCFLTNDQNIQPQNFSSVTGRLQSYQNHTSDSFYYLQILHVSQPQAVTKINK